MWENSMFLCRFVKNHSVQLRSNSLCFLNLLLLRLPAVVEEKPHMSHLFVQTSMSYFFVHFLCALAKVNN